MLARSAIPDDLWQPALGALPFLRTYTADELARLRELVVLFLHHKTIIGAAGHESRPRSASRSRHRPACWS